tara:strand:+ start:435 stop:785 length:351 start_codon:yes stop_codon:yes gene_type:complete
MNIAIILISFALIVYFIFSPNKPHTPTSIKKKNNFYYDFLIEEDLEIENKDKVNLWNRPTNDIINFYARGYTGGQGLIGSKKNKTIADHLRNRGTYSAIAKKESKYMVGVDITLIE